MSVVGTSDSPKMSDAVRQTVELIGDEKGNKLFE